MNRLIGIVVIVAALYGGVMAARPARSNADDINRTMAQRLGYYGILTVGVGILIISGGIDLSIGSVVVLASVLFALMVRKGVPPVQAALAVIALGAFIGLLHGLLVTMLGLQPFLVTLCGMFVHRGLARWANVAWGTGTDPGLGAKEVPDDLKGQVEWLQKWLVGDPLGVPQELLILGVLSLAAGFFLHATVHGRYLFAVGANEEAARYAGIPTARYKVLGYVICSTLAALAGVLELLTVGTTSPVMGGNLQELFAITGAVLGGCSLRGGEGNIIGLILGAAVLPLLKQVCNFAIRKAANELEYVVIGGALLLGTILDELLKRRAARLAAKRKT